MSEEKADASARRRKYEVSANDDAAGGVSDSDHNEMGESQG